MRVAFKFIGYALIALIATITIYIGYLWVTYIDDTVTSGSKYGFSISMQKEDVFIRAAELTAQYPDLQIYISYGGRAGDFISLPVSEVSFREISLYSKWDLLLDGEHEFHNIIRLKFESGALNEIYRHRKYFELP